MWLSLGLIVKSGFMSHMAIYVKMILKICFSELYMYFHLSITFYQEILEGDEKILHIIINSNFRTGESKCEDIYLDQKN